MNCAHLCAGPVRGWVGCIRSGSTYRNTYIGGKSGVRSRTWDTSQPVRRSKSTKCRIARSGKPCAFPAFAGRAGQTFPSWLASRRIVLGDRLPCCAPGRDPDSRVGDTSVTCTPSGASGYCLASPERPQVQCSHASRMSRRTKLHYAAGKTLFTIVLSQVECISSNRVQERSHCNPAVMRQIAAHIVIVILDRSNCNSR